MMRPFVLPALLLLMLLCSAAAGPAQPLYSCDFEQGADLKAYPQVVTKDLTVEIVSGGPDGAGHCLKIANTAPAKYCQATFKGPFPMQKNLVLSFDHREQIAGGKPNYLGIIFNLKDSDKHWFQSDTFGDTWRHCEIVVGDMMSPNQGVMNLATVFAGFNLYGRSDNDALGACTVWLDNVRLEARPIAPRQGTEQRISYSNPPFFNWARSGARARLEYSPDPSFPAAKTVSVECTRNFYMPPEPLAPGAWYWRVYRQGELADSYTDVQRIEILPESHRFTTPPIPADLAARAHPRLILSKPAQGKERESLVAQARSLIKQGVPDDPPVYAPGNPEWPTWIDWYGKVHGGITSAAGVRLQRTAEMYVRTRDPEVRDGLKQMVQKACTWNPEGGSSMRAGDIGAQHLLRGLNWAYDALYGDLTETEREAVRKVIVARADQFWKSLNPFRTGSREYNNHAWLCTLALAESGLVLTGEYPEAADWAEFSRELYVGLFLCGLGYQGDNNEGIAYWGYGLMFVVSYCDMMRDVCGIDLYRHPWLNQTARFPMYTCPPGAWAVSFADTGKPNHSIFGPAETTQVGDLALRTQDPYALWYSGKFAAAPFDPKPPVDLPQSILYRFIGWSVFNTSLVDGGENVTFSLHSGPFWAGHQHEDQNAFVIHAYGDKLAIDSGYYDWYGSPHFTKYSVLTQAHNAVLVNGLEQDSRKAGVSGHITNWFDSPGFGYTVGDASDPKMYQGSLKRWDRRALFIKPGFVVIHDVLGAAQGPAQYDWLLHTVAPIEVDGASFSVSRPKAALRGRFLAPADLNLQVKAGYPVEPVDGYSTRPVPPEQYSHEWTLTARPQQKRQDEDFVAVMQISKAAGGTPAAISALPATGAFAVRCVDGGETTIVLSRKRQARGPMSGAGLQCDGELAAVTLKGKQPVRVLLIGGTSLTLDGRPLIRATATGNYSLLVSPLGTVVDAATTQAGTVGYPQAGPGRWTVTQGAGGKVDSSKGGVTLRLQPGTYEAVSAEALAQVKPAVEKRGELTFNTCTSLVGTTPRRTCWAVLNAEQAGRYSLRTGAPAGAWSVWLDNRPLPEPQPGQTEGFVWLEAGKHLLVLTGSGTLPDLAIASSKLDFAATQILPADYRPSAEAVVIEADRPVKEGDIKGKVMEKVGATGGTAHCVWDALGQWAQWSFETPAAGDYRLLVRGCTDNPVINRLLDLDAGTPAALALPVQMGNTGGWSRTSNDWRYFVVNDKDGQVLRLHLQAGKHTLRMEQLGGSMNLDLFALEPVK